ncbi:thiamine ABC transporter substrate binding subunit [Aureimonas flava]|uniref:Thiamine ABC transporter substrate binding subunit n=1 Tax=Aureimonas flava TaxID=2320271 RepID=A0A3A1WL30_9HYPH|nr:thiamine ABC transporter substrate binding subunit [Aureimonas flava]RIY00171.1 thiamine ABC transporter substrate binding subunit [Aureimonas flava]
MRPALVLLAAAVALASPLAAAAQDADRPVLTVYTYESFTPDWGPGPRIEAAFEAVCGCDLRFVGLDDGVAILTRLKLEGDGTQADVALGLTAELVPELKATGLFAPSGVDLSALTVPGGFSDDMFVPFDYSYLAFVYDAESVANPPTSLAELVSGDPDQKIAIQDARTSTPGLGLLLWMKAVFGDEAEERWAELSRRILTVTPGWSEAYGLFTKGEVPIVLSYTTSPAYHEMEEGTDRYRAAAFSEGHYLQVELAGMLRTSRHPELARRFLAFMLTPEFQRVIPTGNWSLPAAPTGEPLPEAFGHLVQPSRPLEIPAAEVEAHRAEWTAEWLRGLGR